jgi:carboxymethylenebutenolidase
MFEHQYKASDFPREILALFDRYVHGQIDRRGFLDGAGKFAVGGLTAVAILDILSPKYAEAQQVPKDDSRLRTEYATYQSPKGYGAIKGYLARPAKAAGKLPGIVVVHENRGLNPHIEDVARRAALEGFVAFAPDALTPLGGYPGTDEKGVEMQRTLETPKIMEDFVAAAGFLKSHAECTGRIGAVGFCFGGGVVGQLAVRVPDFGAGVPFYGGQPAAADVPRIKAPLLIHYAETDERINAGWPAFETALKANNVRYAMHQYPGTQHGFHNDTTPRFDKAAATLAWQRSIEFFKKNLG